MAHAKAAKTWPWRLAKQHRSWPRNRGVSLAAAAGINGGGVALLQWRLISAGNIQLAKAAAMA